MKDNICAFESANKGIVVNNTRHTAFCIER